MGISVSIVMCTFNDTREHLEASIGSMLAQTHQDFELILVDDGSSLSSKRDIEHVAGRDSRISVISREENQGLAFSLNEGIALAKGDYIARMDADDVSYPTRLEEQVKILQSRPEVAVVGTQAKAIGYRSNLIKVPVHESHINARIFFNSCFIHPTVVMRRKFIESVGGYNPSMVRAQDYDLWIRGRARGYQYSNIDDVLLEYRTYPSSISKKKMRQQLTYSQEIRRRHLTTLYPDISNGAINSFLYLAAPMQSLSFGKEDVRELFTNIFNNESIRSEMRAEVLKRLFVLAVKYRDFRAFSGYILNLKAAI